MNHRDMEGGDEDIVYFNLLLHIVRSSGKIIQLSKLVSQYDDITVLYIPQIDVSLYGKILGTAHDGVIYRKFSVFLSEDDDFYYDSIINDFTHSEWVFSFDSDLDS